MSKTVAEELREQLQKKRAIDRAAARNHFQEKVNSIVERIRTAVADGLASIRVECLGEDDEADRLMEVLKNPPYGFLIGDLELFANGRQRFCQHCGSDDCEHGYFICYVNEE